ncbi:MAG: hypothetical protein ACLP7P_09645 [Rhodomicrobium sp.]
MKRSLLATFVAVLMACDTVYATSAQQLVVDQQAAVPEQDVVWKVLIEACEWQKQEFCGNASDGNGLLACLESHSANDFLGSFTPTCRYALSKARLIKQNGELAPLFLQK